MKLRRSDDDVLSGRQKIGWLLLGMFLMSIIVMVWQGKP